MLNVLYDSYTILNKVYSEGAFLKQAMNTPIDEKNRATVTKICYGVLERDILLSYYISVLCPKNPKLVVRTVLKISMYCIKFLNKPPYAVTDTAVELCNKLGKKGVSGFVNAVLRKFKDYTFSLPSGEIERLSLEYDYPSFAVNRLVKDYGIEEAKKIMSADKEVTCLRFTSNGETYLKEKGCNFISTPFDNVFFADKFVRNVDYDKGIYTFQSIGSVAICDAVIGGGALLDACAAPGGKSVLLSARFDKVVAQEVHPHRVGLIEEYCSRMGVKNVSPVVGDASVFNDGYSEAFDAVLCDVPCSGFGVLKENPDIKLKKSGDTINQLSELQLKILKNSSRYVKKGGVLYYSTCSIFNEENDGVVKAFLANSADFIPEIISAKIPCIKTDFGVQYLPHISNGAGFFVCALRRKK